MSAPYRSPNRGSTHEAERSPAIVGSSARKTKEGRRTPPGTLPAVIAAREPGRDAHASMLQRPLSRLAIAARGDAAMRVIQAARELGRPMSLVALHTDAERDAPFV